MLRDDALQVAGTNGLEQLDATALNLLGEK
jgi:hypothetical protein